MPGSTSWLKGMLSRLRTKTCSNAWSRCGPPSGIGDGNTRFVKGTFTNLVLPSPIPLGGPHRDQAFEQVFVRNLDSIPFNHDVDPGIPVEAASRQNHMRIPPKIPGLLFGVTRTEVER